MSFFLRVSSNVVFFFAIVFYLGLWGVFRLLFYYIAGDFYTALLVRIHWVGTIGVHRLESVLALTIEK